MIYQPNTIHWQRGNVVVHWCDAKHHPGMLMVVTGYTRDGLCKTKYLDPKRGKETYENEVRNLLDPFEFPALVDYLSSDK